MRINRICPFCLATPQDCDEGVHDLAVHQTRGADVDDHDNFVPVAIYQVVCAGCGARGPMAVSEEKAIDDWNEGRNVTF